MKKKILFMVINMNVGGTEKALLNMLSEIDEHKYEVTVLMLEEYGGFLKEIPSWVNIKYLDNYVNIKELLNKPLHINAIDSLKKLKLGEFISKLYLYTICKIKKERSSLFKYILKHYPIIEEEHDLAVAYAGPMDFITYFVVNKIKAKKKAQWIHFDITKIGLNKVFASNIYNKFDKVFVVSKEGKDKLDEAIPSLKTKTEVFQNIISPNIICKMSEDGNGFKDEFDGVRILTVGRLSREKGQDLTIPVLARLIQEGYKVKWYCIGDGPLKKECEELIDEYNIKDEYILLGTNSNPYSYMKECDIYVQSSRHEGYCITLAEARCFDNPIVSTNFTGAKEQIIHEETGLIVDFMEEKMYKAIKRLIDDKELSKLIRKNLKNEIVDSTKEINKLYKLIEDIK